MVIFASPARGVSFTGFTKFVEMVSLPDDIKSLALSESASLDDTIGRLAGVRTEDNACTLGTETLTAALLASVSAVVALVTYVVMNVLSSSVTAPLG